jgi:hypothetical protein
MKKVLFILIPVFVAGLMAFNKFETFTEQQMQKVADGLVERFVWSYTEDQCYEYNTTNTCPKLLPDSLVRSRLNLSNILGAMPNAIAPLSQRDRKMTEEITEWHRAWEDQDSIYQDWVGFALRNRSLFISLWTKNKAVEFWSMVDNAAIAKKLDYSTRQKLFLEMGKAVTYYKNSLNALARSEQQDRTAIFVSAAQISPRYKAYELQEDLWNKQATDLTQANEQLRRKLATIGVTVTPTCEDFYSYQFTRYDRTYDYLFALIRWAARHDDGILTETEISGFKESTVNDMLQDAKKLADVTQKSLYAYQIMK